jgi:NAD(P)-dependent dehydrogenase (short-subunit alcohol dehydrogenase family)
MNGECNESKRRKGAGVGLFSLDGRAAIVTGAGAGIGQAIAIGLAQNGADVAVCDINEEGLAKTVKQVEATGQKAASVRCDVEHTNEIDNLFAEADSAFGRLDILVNNVGHVARSKPEDLALKDWNWVLATGVTAALYCSQQAFKRMSGSDNGGSIINISSIAGATALGRGNLTHSMNKGAIHQLTRELAVEWAKHGIRVNAILPCQVLTEGFQQWLDSPTFDPALMDRFLTGIPMNRLAQPEDIAGPAIFLASDAAAMVTGTLLPVDGGNLALNAGGSHTW